ncbi:unnamed protein product [Withania somnifera]
MVFGRGFTFLLGSLCGVYVAQHYRVPRIGDWIHSGCVKARELEQAYRRPENSNFNEGSSACGCWFRAKFHERNYHRPENIYGNEGGEDKNNELDGPKALDRNEAPEEQYKNKVLSQDLDGAYYRPENFDPNEKQNNNNVIHPRWAEARVLNKPYNPNEAGQE